jgi:hypothetical protein
MADYTNLNVYKTVTLVDRTGLGGEASEFIYDGVRFPFFDEDHNVVTEMAIPQFVAEFLFSLDKYRVWTRPAEGQDVGEYVNRYGIKHCPKSLIETLGPHVAECGLIELDPHTIEGSDAPLYRTGPVRIERINIPPNEQPRDRHRRSPVMVAGR